MAGNITISCNTSLCGLFWVINSMKAKIVTLWGQHEVLEVNVITNIRTIINYPCRRLLVHFEKTFHDVIRYKSHQHHHTFYNQQLYWRSHQKWRQTVSGITIIATVSLQLEHVPTWVWIWRMIITIIRYHNNMQYITMLCPVLVVLCMLHNSNVVNLRAA